MADELMPVGSVVRLEGAGFLAVILGYFVDNGEQLYDYLAAPYPAGLDSPDHAIFLNADAITEVVSRGYQDKDGEHVLEAAASMMAAQEKAYALAGQALEQAGLLGEGEDPYPMI